jgi:hypothetical protein
MSAAPLPPAPAVARTTPPPLTPSLPAPRPAPRTGICTFDPGFTSTGAARRSGSAHRPHAAAPPPLLPLHPPTPRPHPLPHTPAPPSRVRLWHHLHRRRGRQAAVPGLPYRAAGGEGGRPGHRLPADARGAAHQGGGQVGGWGWGCLMAARRQGRGNNEGRQRGRRQALTQKPAPCCPRSSSAAALRARSSTTPWCMRASSTSSRVGWDGGRRQRIGKLQFEAPEVETGRAWPCHPPPAPPAPRPAPPGFKHDAHPMAIMVGAILGGARPRRSKRTRRLHCSRRPPLPPLPTTTTPPAPWPANPAPALPPRPKQLHTPLSTPQGRRHGRAVCVLRVQHRRRRPRGAAQGAGRRVRAADRKDAHAGGAGVQDQPRCGHGTEHAHVPPQAPASIATHPPTRPPARPPTHPPTRPPPQACPSCTPATTWGSLRTCCT